LRRLPAVLGPPVEGFKNLRKRREAARAAVGAWLSYCLFTGNLEVESSRRCADPCLSHICLSHSGTSHWWVQACVRGCGICACQHSCQRPPPRAAIIRGSTYKQDPHSRTCACVPLQMTKQHVQKGLSEIYPSIRYETFPSHTVVRGALSRVKGRRVDRDKSPHVLGHQVQEVPAPRYASESIQSSARFGQI
jgi:hypothetical protein